MEATMEATSVTLLVLSGLYGLIFGSFLNVIILRLPQQLDAQWQRDSRDYLQLPATEEPISMNIAWPRSRCMQCKNTLAIWHNIPLFSYIFLRGRCHHCSAAILIQYPIVEIITAAVTAIIVWHFGTTLNTVYGLIFAYSLIVLTVIDLREQLLPDQVTLPLLWIGLWANLEGRFAPLDQAVLGAIAGYLSLWSIFWVFKLATGKEGMGYGDFKFLAAMGAWLGWQMLPILVLLASLTAAVISLIGILSKKLSRDQPIPFGPFLAAAGAAAFYFGELLQDSYLRLFSI